MSKVKKIHILFLVIVNNEKKKEKREFLQKTTLRKNRFYYIIEIQKRKTTDILNFHQMFRLLYLI